MVGAHTVRGGRYKCDFCEHTSYKTVAGIQAHLKDQHLHSLRLAEKDAEITRLKNQPPKIKTVEKVVEKVVYKTKPDPKYWYHSVFCTACRVVIPGAGIPYGQTIETTPHSSCGMRSLVSVEGGA